MRFILAILICKILSFILDQDKAGKAALSICPNIIDKIELPECIIAITGSNGKTSTVNMINKVLNKAGYSLGHNAGISNTFEGIVSLIINDTTLDGKYHKEILLLEVDPLNAKTIFEYITPSHFVITNNYRDEMSVNGSTDYVINELKKAISPKSIIILNADDPLVSSLDSNELNSRYYGMNDRTYAKDENDYIYDDGYYCPRCKSKLIYSYRQFGHIGKYHCSKCKFIRQKPDYFISSIDLVNSCITINNKFNINLVSNSIHCAYNMLATFAICNLIGVEPKVIVNSLNNYIVKSDRVKYFKLGLNRGTLLICKYDNPVSFNQNIEFIIDQEETCRVFLLIDRINKQYTSNTSWLWDINFESLGNKNVKEIIVTGFYASDIIERLNYADIDMNKVYINKNINEAIKHAKESQNGSIYTLTSYNDERKFTSGVDALW